MRSIVLSVVVAAAVGASAHAAEQVIGTSDAQACYEAATFNPKNADEASCNIAIKHGKLSRAAFGRHVLEPRHHLREHTVNSTRRSRIRTRRSRSIPIRRARTTIEATSTTAPIDTTKRWPTTTRRSRCRMARSRRHTSIAPSRILRSARTMLRSRTSNKRQHSRPRHTSSATVLELLGGASADVAAFAALAESGEYLVGIRAGEFRDILDRYLRADEFHPVTRPSRRRPVRSRRSVVRSIDTRPTMGTPAPRIAQ